MQHRILVLTFLSLGAVAACSASGGDSTFWERGSKPPAALDPSGAGAGGPSGAGASGPSIAAAGVGGASVTAGSGETSTSAADTSSATSTTGASTNAAATSTSATSAASTTSGGPVAVTWTELYTTYFGIGAKSDCSKNGSCHTGNQSGLKCGSNKTTCYNGFVSSGYVIPGKPVLAQPLVDPQQSFLCGTLGGNMPKGGGSCLQAADVQKIESWLMAGAQDD